MVELVGEADLGMLGCITFLSQMCMCMLAVSTRNHFSSTDYVILEEPIEKSFTGQINVLLNTSPTESEYSNQTAAMGKTSQGCSAVIQRTERVPKPLITFFCWCGHGCACQL